MTQRELCKTPKDARYVSCICSACSREYFKSKYNIVEGKPILCLNCFQKVLGAKRIPKNKRKSTAKSVVGLSEIIVDEDFKDIIESYTWYKRAKRKGYVSPTAFVSCYNFKNRQRTQHAYTVGSLIGNLLGHKLMDHIDNNPFNNLTSNLRPCTVAQNSRNVKVRGGKTVRGTTFFKRDGTWRVQIQAKHIGYFKTEQEAHEAYKKAARELYGEFSPV